MVRVRPPPAPKTTTTLDKAAISVEHAVRPGRLDPLTVLGLWCLRRTFVPLLFGGLIAVTLPGRYDAQLVAGLVDPRAALGAVFSPLAGIALAILVRLAVGAVAFLSAGALSVGTVRASDGTRLAGRIRVWSDRARVTTAYRSLRWTWAVRATAVARSGPAGRWLVVVDRALVVLGAVLAVGWVAVLAIRPVTA